MAGFSYAKASEDEGGFIIIYGALPQMVNVHFFCSSKRNEPKKRAPEMPTSAFLGARYTKPYWRYQKGCSSLHLASPSSQKRHLIKIDAYYSTRFRVSQRAVSMIFSIASIISIFNTKLWYCPPEGGSLRQHFLLKAIAASLKLSLIRGVN
jgi:hypothetical protein